jgi:hypothetical protein
MAMIKTSTPIDDDYVHEAILAFRTITTMLSHLQSPTKFASTRSQNLSKDDRKNLKVLDALSAVIVRQHEIVAVMAKASKGSNIEVFASVNNLETSFNIPQHIDNHSGWKPLQWLISPNPRVPKNTKVKVDSLTNRNQSMTLVDPSTSISKDLSMASRDKLLDVFLQNEW